MLRKSCVLAVCLVVLLVGCRKREEKPQSDQPKAAAAMPEGMTAVPGIKPRVFISNKPVTITEYKEYLDATGQDVPDALATAQKPEEPVKGLTLKQAEQFATWKLMRLPTAAEWEKAAQIVGAAAYPWGTDVAADVPRKDAALYLVQTWTKGSDAERKAEQVRADLRAKMIQERVVEIGAAKKVIDEAFNEGKKVAGENWQKVRPALFTVAEQRKKLTEARATQDGQKRVLEILGKVGDAKKKLIGIKVDEKTTKEKLDKAIEEYRQFLAEVRNKVQAEKEEILKTNQKLSEELVDLRKRVEAAGETGPEALAMMHRRMTEIVPDQIKTLQEAAVLRQEVKVSKKEAEEILKRVAENCDKVSQDLAKKSKDLEAQLAGLKPDQELAGKIEQVETAITNVNKSLETQFEPEPHLFKALQELAAASALTKALEAEKQELEKALEATGLAGLPGEAEEPGDKPALGEPTEQIEIKATVEPAGEKK